MTTAGATESRQPTVSRSSKAYKTNQWGKGEWKRRLQTNHTKLRLCQIGAKTVRLGSA